MTDARPRGRPRSTAIDERILGTTRRTLAAGGYAGVSMEDVAREAGVGKQSLYRRWPRKPLLVFAAAFPEATEILTRLPDTGTFAGDVADYARAMQLVFGDPAAQDVVRGILADALADPPTLDLLRERFMCPQVQVLELLVDRARERGEIAPDVSSEAVADALFLAPIGHFLVLGRPETFPEAVERLVARGATRRG